MNTLESSVAALPPVSVFVDSPPLYIRPKNTDWRYTRHILPKLQLFNSNIHVHLQKSWRVAFDENIDWIQSYVARRLSKRDSRRYVGFLDAHELRQSKCGVVFSHGRFPSNSGGIPVVWQNSILDPAMTAYFYGIEDRQAEIEAKAPLFYKSALVHVSTEAEVKRLSMMFPGVADRFFCTPFFLPGVQANSVSASEKQKSKEIEILFVGDDAYRKGLDVVIDAFRRLPKAISNRSKLRIISRLRGQRIQIPDDPRIELYQNLPHGEVLKAMERAQILAVPSRFESYGLVYLEAMSKGTIPIGPEWEVQKELLDNGRCGTLVSPGDAAQLKSVFEALIDDPDRRASLSAAGIERFRKCYHPQVVANRFLEMLNRARTKQGVEYSGSTSA